MTNQSKVLIVGYGSIGKRHLRILSEMAQPQVIRLRRNTAATAPAMDDIDGHQTVFCWDDASAERPDFAIVSNPTSSHSDAAAHLVNFGIPFLMEKPVSNKLDGLHNIGREIAYKRLPVMVGFQLRLHPGYERFAMVIKSGIIGKPISLQGYVGQYLPEWRPGTDYRDSYSAHSDMGGGVIFDLCHEIDIAASVMGQVVSVTAVCGRYSDLEIESEDVAEIILTHADSRISHIHLNYLEPAYRWTTTVLGTQGSVTWNYGEGYVELLGRDGNREIWRDPEGFDRDDLFRAQMKRWLEVLKGHCEPAVDFTTGVEITRIAVAAHQSATERRQIQL